MPARLHSWTVLFAVVLLANCQHAAPVETAATAPPFEQPWGKPTGGIQTSLHPLYSVWNMHDLKIHRLAFDIRNVGNHPAFIGGSSEAHQIEVDGKIYGRAAISVMSSMSAPGKRFDNIELPLDHGWITDQAPGVELNLTPGKHTVRLVSSTGMVVQNDSPTAPTDTRNYSNPVTVEILADPGKLAPVP